MPQGESWDVIVVGVGGVGSAALAHLARRGARALGLDRFSPGHDRGSSHGETRIIRQAYFEHPDYVPLLLEAYRLWEALEQRSGERLLVRCGLLQVGPPNGVVLPGVLESARRFGLPVERLGRVETERRFPGLRVPEGHEGVFEPGAGYLRVERCVEAYAAEALRGGAVLRTGVAVRSWREVETGVEVVTETARETATLRASSLVLAPGAWAPGLLGRLGASLEVRRKPLFWLRTTSPRYRVERGFPTFLFELPDGVFYGFPQLDDRGLKVAEHSGGERVEDPLEVDRSQREEDAARVRSFARTWLPDASHEVLRHAVCLYTMTPDEHFLLGRHPAASRVWLAAGLSGHGFKLTSVLGATLADLALDGQTSRPIDFLSPQRLQS